MSATASDPPGFDLIGDVHGQAESLVRLLGVLGYGPDPRFAHPRRTVVFVGDLIDVGPGQRATIEIARSMVERGAAQAVMGNHEFNAVCFAAGLRPDVEKNRTQHQAFLREFEHRDDRAEVTAWMASLPLWLELELGRDAELRPSRLRVVHACWDERSMRALAPWLDDEHRLSEAGFAAASHRGSDAYAAVETLLKGPEVDLPEGLEYLDKNGVRREQARYTWWSDAPATLAGRAHLPAHAKRIDGSAHPGFPDEPLTALRVVERGDDTPVVFGHYWRSIARDGLSLSSPTTVCVDYSAARGGPLVAYRWSGERVLDAANLVAAPATSHPAARSPGNAPRVT